MESASAGELGCQTHYQNCEHFGVYRCVRQFVAIWCVAGAAAGGTACAAAAWGVLEQVRGAFTTCEQRQLAHV
jgi:hypothetical protein